MTRALFSAIALSLCAISVRAADPVTVAPQSEQINRLIAEGWKSAGIKSPAGRATDYEFMRRAFIDLIGRIPTPEEVLDFEYDRSSTKRAKLINRLLYAKDYEPRVNGQKVKLDDKKFLTFHYTDEYAEHWSNIWTNWLMTRSGHPTYRDQMNVWLTNELGANLDATVTPYNEFVGKLLTATGTTRIDANAANFIIHHLGEPVPMEKQDELGKFDAVPITSRVTRLFLGIQTNCTQCHDHPFNKEWLQSDFWGVNAFFRQTIRSKTPIGSQVRNNMMPTTKDFEIELKDVPASNASGMIFYERRDGKLMAIKPNFLKDLAKAESEETDNKPLPRTAGKTRREVLSDYVVKHDNFGKSYVNRIWGHLFGRGLNKEPSIDDFGSHNEVVHPEMLDNLAKDFAQYKYDTKQLLFWICCSDAYSLSHVANKEYVDQKYEPFFARMPLKAMSPEVLFESLTTATRSEAASDADARRKLREVWMNKLVRNFGDDEGNEMTFNGTVVQALLMMNGKELNDEVNRKSASNPVMKIIAKNSKNGVINSNAVIDELFLTTLNRHPNSDEKSKISTLMNKGAIIAGEAPKDAPKESPKTTAPPVVEQKGKGKAKMAANAPIPAGPRAVMPSGPNDPTFYQDLFWALLNTNEFMLNH